MPTPGRVRTRGRWFGTQVTARRMLPDHDTKLRQWTASNLAAAEVALNFAGEWAIVSPEV